METMNKTQNRDIILSQRIQDRIKWDRRISNTDVHVISRSGKVTLTGKVDSMVKKQAATELANSTKGVITVVNQLEVPTSFLREDEEIKNLLTHKIQKMDFLDKEHISLEVERGSVKLLGVVLSKQKKAQAAGLVWELSGVRDCRNLIQIEEKTHLHEVSATTTKTEIIHQLDPLDNHDPVALAL
jgi:hyperosmotically inducible periplasmic protein